MLQHHLQLRRCAASRASWRGLLLACILSAASACDLEVRGPAAEGDASDALEVSTGDAAPDLDTLTGADLSQDADVADSDAPEADTATIDAPVDVPVDASSDATPDSGTWDLLDAVEPDTSWGACAVAGRPGECLDLALCDGGRVSTPGYCPGPATIQCCTEPAAGTCDPAVYVHPDADLVEAAVDAACPEGMVGLDATACIDVYEAALLEVLQDGSTAPWSPYHNPGTRRVRAVSVGGVVPQGYITGVQAAAACAEADKRLCTDTEWLAACQGAQSWTYPYGPARQDGVCNDARAVHPAIELFGTGAAWIWSELGNACINQLPDSLARTGSHTLCVAEVGAYDLMGNLHEWTADPAGTFRGGFYVDTRINGEGCLYRTTAHDRSHWDYSTGFRCCAPRFF